jgi:hypothetical protein
MTYQSPPPAWEKRRNQVKSKFYYIFWGIATVSVVAGQLYVGSGYRSYANSLNRLFDSIELELRTPGPRFY